jgi:hypothetical protein
VSHAIDRVRLDAKPERGERLVNRLLQSTLIAVVGTAAITGPTTRAFGQSLKIPGTVQAEDFDQGPAGMVYSDTTPGNIGKAYRATDVDMEPTSDSGGGYNLGWVAAGEWMKYTVDVASAGSYDLEVRVASRGAGGIFHIEIDGVDRTGPVTIPETGGWQQWSSVHKRGLQLAAGRQAWRVVMDKDGEFAVGNINFFRLAHSMTEPSSAATTPPPAPPVSKTPDRTDPAASEIVLYASDVTKAVGNWVRGHYTTGAGGLAMQSNDAGWSSPNEPLPAPPSFFEAAFTPEANKPYRVWMRLRANADSKFNDSVWVQFSGAVDADGGPLWRIGTAGGLLMNLESCTNCGVSGWGWQTGAWWMTQDSVVRFPAPTEQTLRVQIREDGVRIDQIVLSADKYLSSPPGTPSNDTIIIPKTVKPDVAAPPASPQPTAAPVTSPRARPVEQPASVPVSPASQPQRRITELAFTPPADHDTVKSYSLSIFRADDQLSSAAVEIVHLGKPAPISGEIAFDISGVVNSLPAGWYYAVVTAHRATGTAASQPSTPFPR